MAKKKSNWIAEREAIRTQMTDEEFFQSDVAVEELENIVYGITKQFKKRFKINVLWANPEMTACTDGNTITINANCQFMDGESRIQKWYLIIGGIIHEIGHILWTPFHDNFYAVSKFAAGIYDRNHLRSTARYEKKGMEYLEKKAYLFPVFAGFFKDLLNIIEDGFLEPHMITKVKGYAECLVARRIKKFGAAESISQEAPFGMPRMEYLTQIAISQIWQYALWQEVKGEAEAVKKEKVCALVKSEIYPIIEKAINEYDSSKRRTLTLKIVITLAGILSEVLEEEQQNQQQQQQQSGQGESQDENQKSDSGNSSNNSSNDSGSDTEDNSNQSDEQGDNNQSQDGKSQNGNNQNGNGQEDSSQNGEADGQEGQSGQSGNQPQSQSGGQQGGQQEGQSEGQQNNQSNGQSNGQQGADYSNASDDIASAMQKFSDAASKGETEHRNSYAVDPKGDIAKADKMNSPKVESAELPDSSAALQQLENAVADGELSKKKAEKRLEEDAGIIDSCQQEDDWKTPCKLYNYSPSLREDYADAPDTTASDMRAVKLSRAINNLIKERERDDKVDQLLSGKVNVSSLCREDKRYFSKNILPDAKPDLEILIMVDESGSMDSRNKMSNARLAAYELYKMARLIDIKASVIGQTTECFIDPQSHTEPLRLVVYADSENGRPVQKDCQDILQLGRCGMERTRDGYAYRYAVRHLAKSEAEKKIVFFISDGQPSATHYHSADGKADIKLGLEEAQKKGIQTVTFGFGPCCNDIESVWMHDFPKKIQPVFIRAENTAELPKKMVRVFEKFLDV